MTVQELIDKLSKIKDKTQQIGVAKPIKRVYVFKKDINVYKLYTNKSNKISDYNHGQYRQEVLVIDLQEEF